ncbi:hypothetical protein NSA50_13135 [Clostridium sp. DSM 100503]|uniref:glycan biosynthesis hexose transferase WsfD n=1 Tax=Clostridium sp. DSM 100503 TaxID=2963282 RepID=UPI00214A26B0|nr:hypothetical protein [Clostridium sp. DSM 100503]MCR1951989.1 hypothetical protein [Clostridium sp. DSM 100503]
MKIQKSIQNKYTKYILGIFAILSIGIISYILFKYPQMGVADQGDFDRVMSSSGLSLLDSDKGNPDFKRFYQYIVTDYKININANTILVGIVSSSLGYLIIFINFICKIVGQGVFRTQYLAIAYAIIYISSIALILKNFNIKSNFKLSIIALLSAFVFMDGNYIVWFNSLYGEPMMLSTLLLFLAAFLYYIRCKYSEKDDKKIGFKIFLLYISAFMFLGSKMQVLTTLPFIIILLAKVLWDNRKVLEPKKLKWLMVFLIIIIIYPIQINIVNKNISKDTQYNSVFYGVLNGSKTPQQDLIDLGLNPDMACEAGKHAYLDASEYVKYVPRTPITEEEFYSKISNGKLAKFYLTHPKRLIEGMEYTAGKAFFTSTSLGKGYRYDSEEPIVKLNRFTTWSDFREDKLPKKLWFIISVFIAIFIVSIINFLRNKSNEEIKNKIVLLWGLMLIGAIQFPMPYVGNGQADTAKQLYLFNFVFDVLLFICLVYILFKLMDFIKKKVFLNNRIGAN